MTVFNMLIGLPGSGKSTFAKKLMEYDPQTVYLSSDKIREELYGDESIQGDANKVFRTLHNRVKENLSKGISVIYDATNVNRKSRAGILGEIRHISGVDKRAYIVWAPYEECIKRDLLRSRTVGENVIKKFILRWETPYFDEGFDAIQVIMNTQEGFNSYTYANKLLGDMDIPHDNPHHQADVGKHCQLAMRYAKEHFFHPMVTFAAMYHDIGKPMTKFFKVGKDGVKEDIAHYYQHDNAGGYLSLGISCNNDGEKLLLSWLISNHMQPFFNSKYYQGLTGSSIRELLDDLHEADLNAH